MLIKEHKTKENDKISSVIAFKNCPEKESNDIIFQKQFTVVCKLSSGTMNELSKLTTIVRYY
jgi:hypothetical protein